jgi:hypothetical protein
MAIISMQIWDVTGSRSQIVQAPDDVPLGRLLVILAERMNLPLNSPDGRGSSSSRTSRWPSRAWRTGMNSAFNLRSRPADWPLG